MNKEVANTASLSAVVKKGTAARASKFTIDGSKIIIAMEAKLTAGAYTVTIEGLEATALTADLSVEKDETLTTYEVSDYIVAQSVTNTTTGVIKYAALNQYGEKMAADAPQVSCSFGTVAAGAVTAPTATKEGEIVVTGIHEVLALVGTKGTVVLVDTKSGVTVTKEISYNTAATASTMELAGTYHINTGTIKSIAENDAINEYELLFTAKDQYGYDLESKDLNLDGDKKVKPSLAGGLTNIKLVDESWGDRTVAGIDYITLKLTGDKAAVAGDATLTVVNPSKGLLLTTTVSVVKDVVIKTLNITAEDGVYAEQENELVYEAIDANGQNVTSYAVLTKVLDLGNSGIKLVKNADGTAKMVYTPGEKPVDSSDELLGKATTIEAETIYANKATSGDYLVKPLSFTVRQKRMPKTVTGIASDAVTSVACNQTLKINTEKLLLADQYSNSIANTEQIFKDVNKVSSGAIDITGTAVKVVASQNVVSSWTATGSSIEIIAGNEIGTATVYLKFNAKGNETISIADNNSNADAKFTVSVTNTKLAANVEIESVFSGFVGKATSGKAIEIKKSDIKVVGMSGGSKTVIPEDQYVIEKVENGTITTDEANKGTDSKKATVTVQVTTKDASGNEVQTTLTKDFEISVAPAKVYKVVDVSSVDKTKPVSKSATEVAKAVTAGVLQGFFTFNNQYNGAPNGDTVAKVSSGDSIAYNVKYTAQLKEGQNDGYEVIAGNGLNGIDIRFSKDGVYIVTITAETEDGSKKSVDIKFIVN